MFGVKPPGVKETWDDCNLDTKSNLLAYSQIRSIEDTEDGQR
jgi:hypothetical protein